MNSLLKIAGELIDISRDLVWRVGTTKFDTGELYDFDQTWDSTALGFGGVGGSALTTARTYVFIPDDDDRAYVYFGGRFAYKTPINERFKLDLRTGSMASVAESGRYSK